MQNNTEVWEKDGKQYHRQPCEIYTRVMGYHRPVSSYNLGKQCEFYSRTNFEVKAS